MITMLRARSFLTLIALMFAITQCDDPTYSFIQFKIYTGGDNLDGGKSTAVGFFYINGGPSEECYLNTNPPLGVTALPGTSLQIPPIPGEAQVTNATWDNDSLHTVVCQIGPLTTAQLLQGGSVKIALYQKSCESSCDNWDIEGVEVSVLQQANQTSGICALKTGFWGPGDNGGNPAIARLKGAGGQPAWVVSFTNDYPFPNCR